VRDIDDKGPTMPSGSRPIGGGHDRVMLIDALRAASLLGVIAMNYNAMVMTFVGRQVIAAAGPVDLAMSLFDLVLVQGKARSIFAMLFGVGFGLLMMRSSGRGAPFAGWYLRRMVALLLIGSVNLTLLFWGDILVLYASLGMAMLVVRGWSDRAIGWSGLSLVLLPPLMLGVAQAVAGGPLPPLGRLPARLADAVSAAPANYAQGGYGSFVEANLTRYAAQYVTDRGELLVYDSGVLGLFMLGFWISRKRVLIDVAAWRPALRRMAWWCVPTGLILSALHATQRVGVADGMFYALSTVAYVGLPILAAGYASALILLLSGGRGRAIRVLAPMGRMALTGYLLSNLAGSFVFYGWGLGLMRQANLAAINLLAFGVFAALCCFSAAWLKAFRQGPVEAAWRWATDARPPLSWLPPRHSLAG